MVGVERVNSLPVLIWMLHFVQHDDVGDCLFGFGCFVAMLLNMTMRKEDNDGGGVVLFVISSEVERSVCRKISPCANA